MTDKEDIPHVTFAQFNAIDIRVGTIQRAEAFHEAIKPSIKLWIDFGEHIGLLKSSAQITMCYAPEDLLHKQVLGVVNFAPKQISNFMSECLVLGVYSEKGVVLIAPDKRCSNGDKLG